MLKQNKYLCNNIFSFVIMFYSKSLKASKPKFPIEFQNIKNLQLDYESETNDKNGVVLFLWHKNFSQYLDSYTNFGERSY